VWVVGGGGGCSFWGGFFFTIPRNTPESADHGRRKSARITELTTLANKGLREKNHSGSQVKTNKRPLGRNILKLTGPQSVRRGGGLAFKKLELIRRIQNKRDVPAPLWKEIVYRKITFPSRIFQYRRVQGRCFVPHPNPHPKQKKNKNTPKKPGFEPHNTSQVPKRDLFSLLSLIILSEKKRHDRNEKTWAQSPRGGCGGVGGVWLCVVCVVLCVCVGVCVGVGVWRFSGVQALGGRGWRGGVNEPKNRHSKKADIPRNVGECRTQEG